MWKRPHFTFSIRSEAGSPILTFFHIAVIMEEVLVLVLYMDLVTELKIPLLLSLRLKPVVFCFVGMSFESGHSLEL